MTSGALDEADLFTGGATPSATARRVGPRGCSPPILSFVPRGSFLRSWKRRADRVFGSRRCWRRWWRRTPTGPRPASAPARCRDPATGRHAPPAPRVRHAHLRRAVVAGPRAMADRTTTAPPRPRRRLRGDPRLHQHRLPDRRPGVPSRGGVVPLPHRASRPARADHRRDRPPGARHQRGARPGGGVRTGQPSVRRLVVFDYRPGGRPARAPRRGPRPAGRRGVSTSSTRSPSCSRAAHPAGRTAVHRRRREPAGVLIYTSGSTGTPKGAMTPRAMVAQVVEQSLTSATVPVITLNYMPLNHVAGRIGCS